MLKDKKCLSHAQLTETLWVRLICKMKVLDRTVHDSTRQNITGQTFTILNKFCLVWYLMEKMLFWWFRKVVLRTKSCPMVQWGTRISDFVQSLDPQFVQYQWQFSNQTQYNRSCPVQSPVFYQIKIEIIIYNLNIIFLKFWKK